MANFCLSSCLTIKIANFCLSSCLTIKIANFCLSSCLTIKIANFCLSSCLTIKIANFCLSSCLTIKIANFCLSSCLTIKIANFCLSSCLTIKIANFWLERDYLTVKVSAEGTFKCKKKNWQKNASIKLHATHDTYPVLVKVGAGQITVVSFVGVVGLVVNMSLPLVNRHIGPLGPRLPRKPVPVRTISKVAPRHTLSGVTRVISIQISWIIWSGGNI